MGLPLDKKVFSYSKHKEEKLPINGIKISPKVQKELKQKQIDKNSLGYNFKRERKYVCLTFD